MQALFRNKIAMKLKAFHNVTDRLNTFLKYKILKITILLKKFNEGKTAAFSQNK